MGTARRRIQRRQRAHRDHLATIAPRPKSTTTSTNAPECLPHPSPGRDWTIGFAIVDGVDEWDIYQTDEVAAWLRELQGSDSKTAGLVDDAIYTLSVSGPVPVGTARSASCSYSTRGARRSCSSSAIRREVGTSGTRG
jgi:hypothetical protein